MRPGSDTYRVPQDLSQNQHIEGLPLGTVGGLQVRHTFPLDAEYEFRTQLYRTNLNIVRGLQYPSEFEIAIDGQQVHHVTIGGNEDLAAMFDKPTDTGDAVELRMRVRVPVKAGPHEVTATFIENMAVKDTIRLQPFLRSSADNFDWAGRPHIQTFTVTGPFNADGHRRHAKPPRDLHVSSDRARDASATARRRSWAGSLAARIGNRSRRRSSSRSSASTTRPSQGDVRERHPARPRAHPREPALRVPRRARS